MVYNPRMYYSYPCPKCGTLITEFEGQTEGDYDAPTVLSGLVKQHFDSMHTSEEQVSTDEELYENIKAGMQVTEQKPY